MEATVAEMVENLFPLFKEKQLVHPKLTAQQFFQERWPVLTGTHDTKDEIATKKRIHDAKAAPYIRAFQAKEEALKLDMMAQAA